MKWRYLFEKWGDIRGTNELTKQHLIDVKEKRSEFLIDVFEGKYFDAEDNSWKLIEGSE